MPIAILPLCDQLKTRLDTVKFVGEGFGLQIVYAVQR